MIAATSDWTLERAARTMVAGHFRHLMVVEEHKVVGILSMSDIVATWARESDEAAAAVSEDTGELPELGPAHDYLYTLRRTAKQHRVAAKCECQWEWLQVLTASSRTGRTSTARRSSTSGSGASPAPRCTPRAAERTSSIRRCLQIGSRTRPSKSRNLRRVRGSPARFSGYTLV